VYNIVLGRLRQTARSMLLRCNVVTERETARI
jgi:hypothetical protein